MAEFTNFISIYFKDFPTYSDSIESSNSHTNTKGVLLALYSNSVSVFVTSSDLLLHIEHIERHKICLLFWTSFMKHLCNSWRLTKATRVIIWLKYFIQFIYIKICLRIDVCTEQKLYLYILIQMSKATDQRQLMWLLNSLYFWNASDPWSIF